MVDEYRMRGMVREFAETDSILSRLKAFKEKIEELKRRLDETQGAPRDS